MCSGKDNNWILIIIREEISYPLALLFSDGKNLHLKNCRFNQELIRGCTIWLMFCERVTCDETRFILAGWRCCSIIIFSRLWILVMWELRVVLASFVLHNVNLLLILPGSMRISAKSNAKKSQLFNQLTVIFKWLHNCRLKCFHKVCLCLRVLRIGSCGALCHWSRFEARWGHRLADRKAFSWVKARLPYCALIPFLWNGGPFLQRRLSNIYHITNKM